MSPIRDALRDAVRLTALLAPRGNPALAGAGAFLSAALVHVALAGLRSAVDTPAPRSLFAHGLPGLLADAVLVLAAAWLLARASRRPRIVWGIATTLLLALAVSETLVRWPARHLATWLVADGHPLLSWIVGACGRGWWLLMLVACARALGGGLSRRLLAAALGAFLATVALGAWVRPLPLFTHVTVNDEADEQANNDDIGETPGAEPTDAADFDAEAVMYAQPRLLDEALARLRPRTPGRVNLYVLAFAGDGGERVFRNEAEYVERLFTRRFGADGRVLVLENSAETTDTRPLATLTNLGLALDGIARRMDPAEDVLLVYLTSHGSAEHELAVALDPLPLNQIRPDDLADALRTQPRLRWKMLVVNACYSGGFVERLRDDSTMVLTSARRDRTSFGCGAQSDITYFGRAFLADALNRTSSLREAFELARTNVAAWEKRDGEQASQPQIATSPRIEAQLERWRATLAPTPAVPFAPTASETSP